MEKAERVERKVLQGVVLSNKMKKTLVVSFSEKVRHPKYGKLVERRKKCYAHNESEAVKEGDVVELMQVRPLSKLKRWRVTKLVKS